MSTNRMELEEIKIIEELAGVPGIKPQRKSTRKSKKKFLWRKLGKPQAAVTGSGNSKNKPKKKDQDRPGQAKSSNKKQ
jgi:hypothetical protein